MNIISGASLYSSALRTREHQRNKDQINKETSNEKLIDESSVESANDFLVEEESANNLIAKAAQNVDESLISLTQFRSRRDLSQKSGADLDSNYEAILDDNTFAKLALFLRSIRNVQGNNINDLKFRLIKLFPDESDRVMILRKLLSRKNVDDSTRLKLVALLENIKEEANPKRLKAGINVSLKAKLSGKTLTISPQLLRSAYREFIEAEMHEVEIYQSWVAVFGYEKRKDILVFVEGALLNDIDSVDPSCSLIEFGNFLSRLCQLKNLRTLDINFINKLLINNQVNSVNASEQSWLFFLMCILQDAENLDDYLEEITKGILSSISVDKTLSFLQAVLKECMFIPSDFFSKANDKSILETEFKIIIERFYKKELLSFR